MKNQRYLVPAHAPRVTAPQIPPVKGPSHEDWNRHRSLIKYLYADENLKLKDVMDIMLKHGHKASTRTFKSWIKKWGLEKNNKERDMAAIVRKKIQRDAIGKQSSFRVRGQPVIMENVVRYFKRKKEAPIIETLDASTPSDISCRTPSPPSTLREFEDSARPSPAEDDFGTAQFGDRFYLASNSNEETHGVSHGELAPLSRSKVNKVSRSSSAPQAFVVSEHLFLSIKKLIEGSFENGTWVVSKNGCSKSKKAVASSGRTLEYNFNRYCNIAIEFLEKGYFFESRRALSKMFSLICGLLQDGGPRTLDTCFKVFYDLQKEYHKIWLSLRYFIYEISRNNFLRCSPLAQILRILCALDDESLEQIMFQCWSCVIDGFTKFLGPFNPDTIFIHIWFIRSAYRFQEPLEEERCYRSLLAQSKLDSNATACVVLNIMFALINNLIDQIRYDEAEILALDMLFSAQKANLSMWEIDAKRLVARIQYHQHKGHLAEENKREVIKMFTCYRGKEDLLVFEQMVELEQWLREWGREKEACDLKAEIDELIGPDETDLEMAQMA